MQAVARRQREPTEWGAFFVWIGIILACLGFWFGVGYGLNVAWHAIWPDPKPAPPVIQPGHGQVVCVESSPPQPQIGTAIVCTLA